MEGETLEQMEKRFQEMEQEAQKLKEMQQVVEKELGTSSKEEVDQRSIYVGNVDYTTTPEELQSYFSSCGLIQRVTILCDKHTGHPKGFAYVEFNEQSSVQNSLSLHETIWKGRVIQVVPKRTNVPMFQRGRGRGRRGRGRPFRSRGRGRGYQPY
jgi:polyadenylate-binding protein 2